MKKLALTAMLGAASLGLAACGDTGGDNSANGSYGNEMENGTASSEGAGNGSGSTGGGWPTGWTSSATGAQTLPFATTTTTRFEPSHDATDAAICAVRVVPADTDPPAG